MIVVDARGMRCPWPALRAARALRDDAMVEVIADDPAAARELAALASERGIAFTSLNTDPMRFVLGLVETSTRP